jgi:hypothetical protein
MNLPGLILMLSAMQMSKKLKARLHQGVGGPEAAVIGVALVSFKVTENLR